MTTSTPPEGWLLKAHDESHDESVLVDLIFRPAGGPIGTSTSSARRRWS